MLKRATTNSFLIIATLLILTGTSFGHAITHIVASPPSPASLSFGEHIDYTFDYITDSATGVRIFIRATGWDGDGVVFASHGSPLYPEGAGSGTGYFTVTSGSAEVTQVRFQMWDSDQSTLLLEFFIDVNYSFGIVSNENETFGGVKTLFR